MSLTLHPALGQKRSAGDYFQCFAGCNFSVAALLFFFFVQRTGKFYSIHRPVYWTMSWLGH